MLRILIADDHEIVRKGIVEILKEDFPTAYIEEADDAASLVKKAIYDDWDVIISDLAMPGGGGFYVLERIAEKYQHMPVLILSIYPEEQYALRIIKAGAAGYLNKDAAPEELANAVKRILSGERYITFNVAKQLSGILYYSPESPLHELLNENEISVFSLLMTGSSIGAIAEKLGLSSIAVNECNSVILNKMQVKNNNELIHHAIRQSSF